MKRLLPVLCVLALVEGSGCATTSAGVTDLVGADGQRFVPCPGEYHKETWDNCAGSFTYSDGSQYVGNWKMGKFHGEGTYIFASGEKYVGRFREDKYHGEGTYTYANGDRYVGEWEEGEFEGEGTYTRSTNGRYFGEEVDDIAQKYARESKASVAVNDKGAVKEGEGADKENEDEEDREKKRKGKKGKARARGAEGIVQDAPIKHSKSRSWW